MKQNLKIQTKRLMATVIICLFSIISIGTGKIFTNHLNTKNNIVTEQDFIYNINQNIEQELPYSQHNEWLKLSNNHSLAFLKVNSINNNIKEEKNFPLLQRNNLFTISLSTILANLISSAKAHLKENIVSK